MREFFTRNLSLKLVSVALAISLELYFMSPTNLAIETMKVPVEILNVPSTMVTVAPIIGPGGLSAEVKIRGPQPLVERALNSPHKFLTRIPDTDGLERAFDLELRVEQLGLPAGVDVVEMQPARIEVRLEPSIKREIPIRLVKEGEVKEGYFIENAILSPDRIVVSGPQSEVDAIEAIDTEALNLGELRASRSIDVDLIPVGTHTVYESKSVRADITLSPKLAERSFENLKITVIAPNGMAATADSTRAKLYVTGSEPVLGALTERDIELQARVDQYGQGQHTVEVAAKLPAGVKLLKVQPASVRVTLARSNN